MAAGWLKRGGRGAAAAAARSEAAAELAKAYFRPAEDASGEPAPKRQKIQQAPAEVAAGFSPELLEKAPASIQTCRSLLQFLEKKLAAPVPEAPAVGGPAELRAKLESYAEGHGRLDVLKGGGWDARAKRILDISAATTAAEGKSVMEAAEAVLDKAACELKTPVEAGGAVSLDAVVKERRQWAQAKVKLEWFDWCRRLVKTREQVLVEVGEDATKAKEAVAKQEKGTILDSVGILASLLGSASVLV